MSLVNYSEDVVLIACEAIKPEIERVNTGCIGLRTFYLQQSLNNKPKNMPSMIQNIVDQIPETVKQIIIGYGLCSNGIVDVQARTQGIIVPRCRDCIAFFLGSSQTYIDDFYSRPGSYYLTPNWIADKKDPLSIIEEDYVPRYGWETAEWAKKEELKHYTHIVLIDTGVADLEPMREIGIKNAKYFRMEYLEIEGRRGQFFRKLVNRPYPEDEFIRLAPGKEITQDMFIG